MKNITVAKFGSELVANGEGILPERISEYASGLAETHYEGGLIVVTSGAVMAGKARILERGDDVESFDNVTLAQLGSSAIMSAWEEAFDSKSIYAGGLLTTHREIGDSKEGPSLFRAIELARSRGVICIINENDALSDKELMKLANCEDNDGLSAHIAIQCGAAALKIFTKLGGIVDNEGRLIDEVNWANYGQVSTMLRNRRSVPVNGRGGIYAKFNASCSVSRNGIQADISMPNIDMTGDKVTRVVLG